MNYSALTATTRVTALRETSTGGRLPLAQSHVARAYLGQGGEPATTEQVRRRVHWITSQVRGPRVLDIGTSGGLVPLLLGREGFHVVGIGPDVGATDWADELLEQEPQVVRDRVQFRNASLLQEDRALQFDTLILSDVLEHVSNVVHFIDTAVKHLTSGGRLIASVPFGLHPDRTHKHSFFISDIQRLFSRHGRIEHLSVVDGYIRLILARDEAATDSENLPASSLADALALTEEATLAAQSLLWRQLDTAAQQVERLRDEVAGAEQRASQAEEEKLEKQAALEAAAGDLSLLQERLRAADTRLQERQQELEELRRSLDARSEEASDARAQAAELRARHDLLQQELRQREVDLVRAREQQETAQEKLAERQARIAILEQSLAQAASHFSSRGGINETGTTWLTEAARDEAEVAVPQQQLEDAERLLAERTAQLEEQKASVAEWVDEYARLEEEKEKAEQRAADAEGSLRATGQELLQAQQALVEAEARHEAALAQLDERQLLIEEQAEELKELRGRIENFAKQLELNAHALEQARQREQKASQELSVRNARIAELEQRVAQQIESLSTQESELSRLQGSQEALGKEVRTLRQQLATQEKAYAALEQQLIQESAQVSARSHELEKSQAARTALAAEADKLRKRLDAANYEKQAAEQELAALKAVAANQLTVLDGERLLWVEPLLELFRRVEVQAHRPVEPRQRSFLGSRSRIKQPDTAKLEPRKLANLSTEIAKERYRDDPFAMLLLASLADALDPQPARRKWLGFRMVHAGLLDGAEQVLTPLQGKMPFSPSEQKAWDELVARPKPPESNDSLISAPQAAGDTLEVQLKPARKGGDPACRKRLLEPDVAPKAEIAEKREGGEGGLEAGNAASETEDLQRSLKLPAPKPSTELLFSAHTEPMVKALKGEGSAAGQKAAVEVQATPVEQAAPADETVQITSKQLILNGNSKKTVENVIKVPVPGATLELSAAVVYRLKSGATTRKAVLLFDFLDKEGSKIATLPGIGVAAAFKQHFRYLNANSKSVDAKPQEVFKLTLPAEVASVSLSVGTLGISDEEQIELSIQGRCYSEKAEKERKRQLLQRQPLPEAIVHDPRQKRYTSDLTVACVLDEFTAECLSHEVKLIKVTQEAWQSQIEQNPPDFLLVESCWKGNDGNWGTITKGSGGRKKLSGLLRYCKQHAIPTVFWNKEDPPHYDKFGPIAALFDLAITTDVNMVPHYKADFGIDAYPLSFGAQPKVHNPEPVIPRLQKAVFAGSYYGDKPKRCEDFNDVMGQLELAGVQYDIFDRNFQQGIEKFFFPDHYQGNIVGNLPPEEVWKAHKGYKYQINMNSVQDSATMFARRVYESLASGTPVISNDSVGVRELFGDIVIMPGEQSIAEQLRALEASPQAYHELARRGVRAVMREHTYGHRIQALCRLLGIEVEVDLPKATLAVTARSEADIDRAKQLFAAQTAPRKHLFIELDNFDTAYQFLNASDDNVTYAMQLAHEFYADERQYYGGDRVLKHDVEAPLAAEALEDFLYWGAGGAPSGQPQATQRVEVGA